MTRAFACILVLVAVTSASACRDASSPVAHERAPEFEVKLASGDTFRPEYAKGRVLVLDFWTSWCSPCRASLPALDAIYRERKDQGLMVVSINEDEDASKARAFSSQLRLSYPIGMDDGSVARALGVETLPAAFVVDRRGFIRYVHLGYPADVSVRLDGEIKELLAESP
jgi:thiol-disulfide isomerase/thioredoxin